MNTYYLIYDKEFLPQKDFIEGSLNGLSKYINDLLGIDYRIRELPDNLKSDVNNILNNMKVFCETSADISDFFVEKYGGITNLVVFCGSESNIGKVTLKDNPAAFWGGACGRLAAIYNQNNKHLIWHEILHLFGATDCYNPENSNSVTTCENPNCLMQYAPCNGNISLCKKNIEILTKSFGCAD